MSTTFDVPVPTPPVSVATVTPAAAVSKHRWVLKTGAQASVAGSRAYGIARQNFSANEATAAGAGALPTPSLAVTILGWEQGELGADAIPDNSVVTTDNQGRTVVASNPNDEILGFLPKGGDTGELRPVFVFRNDDTRGPAAAVADLTGAGGGTANGALEDEGVVTTAGGNTYTDAAVNTVIAKLKNNVAELAATVAALQGRLRLQKIIAP
jgi:hypothetical protein